MEKIQSKMDDLRLPYFRKPPRLSPPNPSFMLIPARGPLKNTFDRIRDSADFAWRYWLVYRDSPFLDYCNPQY